MDDNDQGIIGSINNSKLKGFHYRTWLISGMGFFTDAYDLFIIGIVVSILPLAGWNHIPEGQIALVSSTALLSAVIGASAFGALLDKYGRKAVYGINLILLIIGALGSAFLTPNNSIAALIGWRFLLGIGIGGDYSISSTIMTEYSNTKSRGKLVGMVFSMQSIGLIAGPALTLGLIYSGLSLVLVWKLLLAIGAVPAIAVVYWRRKLPETPKFTLLVEGDAEKAARNWEKVSGVKVDGNFSTQSAKLPWYTLFKNRKFLITLIGTAGSWFLMDWALYGNTIMSSTMLSGLIPSGTAALHDVILKTEYSGMVFAFAAFPGYWIATMTLDRIGRKTIQMVGFLAMTGTYLALGIFSFLLSPQFVLEFLLIYGLSYFFIEFGPNVTTFVYPPEVFPTSTRGLGTGLSASGGKIGAFVGTILNLVIQGFIGESGLFLVLSGLSFLGFSLTYFALPETKNKDLEEITGELELSVQTPPPEKDHRTIDPIEVIGK